MLPDRRAKYYNHLKNIERNGFDLTETMLNLIYTKDNFNKDEFYKKIRSKFIKSGYTDEKLKDDINHILSTLVKYNIIDENYKINKNLTTKTL